MNNKVILIIPPITHQEMHGELASAGSEEPSLGICYIAGSLRQAGYDVSIIDALALRIKPEDVVSEVAAARPDYVGLSAVTLTISHAHKLAEAIKLNNPDIQIILGGAHLSALPEVTMKRFKAFDYGVIGEGERTIVNLLNSLKAGQPLEQVKGIIFRRDGNAIITQPAENIKDLDSLPLPAWDLLPDLASHYHPPAYSLGRIPSSSIITTRGCGFKCIFCFQQAFGRKVRAHSAERVLEMIETLYHKYGIRDLRIVDDNFTLFRERLFKITEGIKKRKLDITFSCFARVDTLTEEMVRELKSAGCWQILFGIESGVQRILDLVQKNITLEQVEKTVIMTKKYGIHALGYFMIGFPTETEDTINQTINFALRLPLDEFKMQFLTPLPGSALYEQADKYGYFDKNDFEAMNTDTEPCFVPFNIDKEQMIRYQKKAFRDFYFRPRIILNYMKFLTRPRTCAKLFKGALALTRFTFSK